MIKFACGKVHSSFNVKNRMEGGQLFHQLRKDYSSLSEKLRNWMEAEKIEGSKFKRD